MSRFKSRNAARLTRVRNQYVKASWHNARNDAVGTPLQARRKTKPPVNYSRKKHGPHEE